MEGDGDDGDRRRGLNEKPQQCSGGKRHQQRSVQQNGSLLKNGKLWEWREGFLHQFESEEEEADGEE